LSHDKDPFFKCLKVCFLLTSVSGTVNLPDMSANNKNKTENSLQKTQAALVRAAVKEFAEHGYRKTLESDIAVRAGMPKEVFYNHFPSKEALFRFLSSRFLIEISDAFFKVDRLFVGETGAAVRAGLKEFILTLIEIYTKNHTVVEILFRERSGHGGQFGNIYENIFLEVIRLIEYRLQLGVNVGRLKVKDTHMAAVFLMGLFEQTVFYSMLMPAKPEPHELAVKISDFMLHGLGFRDDP